MGAITRGFANNIGSAGRLASGAINNKGIWIGGGKIDASGTD